MTRARRVQLLAELDRAAEPGEGYEPSRLLAESKSATVFREFLTRMHESPSPEVRYWCCYRLIWENTACAEFIQVVQRPGEYPEIRAQALEGLANALDCAGRRLAWHRQAVAVALEALDDPAVDVRWWACFALGVARARKAVDKLRELATFDHTMLPGWWTVAEEAQWALDGITGKHLTEPTPSGTNKWSWGSKPTRSS